MSSFVCSRKTRTRVAIMLYNCLNGCDSKIKPFLKLTQAFAPAQREDGYLFHTIYKMLYKLNVESVNDRYLENTNTDTNEEPLSKVGECQLGFATPVSEYPQLHKSLRCFIYNSADKWEQDDVLDALEEFRDKIVDVIAGNYPDVKTAEDVARLPGYNELDWD